MSLLTVLSLCDIIKSQIWTKEKMINSNWREIMSVHDKTGSKCPMYPHLCGQCRDYCDFDTDGVKRKRNTSLDEYKRLMSDYGRQRKERQDK